jgi:hypothetical protein
MTTAASARPKLRKGGIQLSSLLCLRKTYPSAEASNGLHLPSAEAMPPTEYWSHSVNLNPVNY